MFLSTYNANTISRHRCMYPISHGWLIDWVRLKDEEVNGQGWKRGAPAPHGAHIPWTGYSLKYRLLRVKKHWSKCCTLPSQQCIYTRFANTIQCHKDEKQSFVMNHSSRNVKCCSVAITAIVNSSSMLGLYPFADSYTHSKLIISHAINH